MEETGWVAIWVWTGAGRDPFASYVVEQTTDPSRPFSEFAVDLGVGEYDVERLEATLGGEAVTVEQLLRQIASGSLSTTAAPGASALGIERVYGIVLLYDHRWEGDWTSAAPIHFVGNHELDPEIAGPELRPTDHRGRIVAVAISPDGRRGATTARGGELFLWDLETGELLARGGGIHEEWVHQVVFAPDGRLVSTGNEVACWTVDGSTLRGRRLGDRGGAQMLGLQIDSRSPDAALATCVDGSLTRWHLDAGMEIVTRIRGRLTGLAVAPEGSAVAKWNEDGVIVVRDGHVRWSVDPEPGAYDYVALCGARVVLGRPDEGAVAYDLATGARAAALDVVASCCAAHAQGAFVALGAGDRICLWNLRDKPTVFHAHEERVLEIAIASDRDLVMSVGRDGTAALWSSRGELLGRFNPAPSGRARAEAWRDDPWALESCAGRPDGTRWLVGGTAGQVHLLAWDGKRLEAIPPRSA